VCSNGRFVDIGHLICIENAKIIAIMDHYGKRNVQEALEIEINDNINIDESFKIKETSKASYSKIYKSRQ
jgi:hypothetical protein